VVRSGIQAPIKVASQPRPQQADVPPARQQPRAMARPGETPVLSRAPHHHPIIPKQRQVPCAPTCPPPCPMSPTPVTQQTTAAPSRAAREMSGQKRDQQHNAKCDAGQQGLLVTQDPQEREQRWWDPSRAPATTPQHGQHAGQEINTFRQPSRPCRRSCSSRRLA